jgi:hypothetical protein
LNKGRELHRNGQFVSGFVLSPHLFNGFAKVLLVNIFRVKEILRAMDQRLKAVFSFKDWPYHEQGHLKRKLKRQRETH